jgi:hypothetical protein
MPCPLSPRNSQLKRVEMVSIIPSDHWLASQATTAAKSRPTRGAGTGTRRRGHARRIPSVSSPSANSAGSMPGSARKIAATLSMK